MNDDDEDLHGQGSGVEDVLVLDLVVRHQNVGAVLGEVLERDVLVDSLLLVELLPEEWRHVLQQGLEVDLLGLGPGLHLLLLGRGRVGAGHHGSLGVGLVLHLQLS